MRFSRAADGTPEAPAVTAEMCGRTRPVEGGDLVRGPVQRFQETPYSLDT